MSGLNFTLLMRVEAGAAKAELRALQGEEAKLAAETSRMAREAARAGQEVDRLGASAGQSAVNLGAVDAAQRQTADGARAMANSHQLASGSVANLTAQFNDIFTMIAAGQNPFQLAMQQGTQITQVLGPMGAGGAVRALGAAFMSALNPFNLLTLGVIAGGAAIIQWLTSAGAQVKTLEDAIDGLQTSVGDLRKASDVDLAGLKKTFGEVNADVLKLHDSLVKLAGVDALRAQREAVASLRAETEGSWFAMFNDSRWDREGQVADILGSSVKQQLTQAYNEIDLFIDTIDKLETARGPQESLGVYQQLEAQIVAATGGVNQMTERQLEFYRSVVQTQSALREMIQAQQEAARQAEVLGGNGRMGAPLAGMSQPEPRINPQDVVTARELLATLQQETSLQQTVAQYGRDSANAALARLDAERQAFEQSVQALDVSSDLKDQLNGAWEAANGLARARIAASIEAALGPASRLRSVLAEVAGFFSQIGAARDRRVADLATQYSMYGRGSTAARDAVIADDPRYGGDGNGLTPGQQKIVTPASGASGRAGAGAARAEADAVAELTRRLREELETMQELDPVAAEMLRYREQLKDASAAERASIETLIRTKQQLKAAEQAGAYFTNVASDFLNSVIVKGAQAGDVIRNLVAQFAVMAAQSFITGKGWVAEIFGVSGGLFADGGSVSGPVYGAGGPRDDRVPAMLSPGEFVINAKSTARYRPVLERINAGGSLKLAGGGYVGQVGRAAASQDSGGATFHIAVNGATGNTEIAEMTAKGIRAALRAFAADEMPGRVKSIVGSPRVMGGF